MSKLAVDHLEKTRRPLRIAIDASIWSFQNQAGQGGKNPALRTLFYRLLKLLALPIHPVFVYDGKNKPLQKRGKTVSRYGTNISNETSKKLVQLFRFPHHTAPGEAEAECAFLQRRGIVDVVMSQDVDALMFGSRMTIRDWSKEGTRGNKSPTHVDMLDLEKIKHQTGLDSDGMILVALLSGGDYDATGVVGFGPALACEIARAGFGTDLIEHIRNEDAKGLDEWRQRLHYELATNESGYFRTKHKSISVPESFPDRTILNYYLKPAVSAQGSLPRLEDNWTNIWDTPIDIAELRRYTAETFDWQYRLGAYKFVRTTAPALLAQKLRLGMADNCVRHVNQLSDQRKVWLTGGIPEMRISVVPAEVTDIDLDSEIDDPEQTVFAGNADEELADDDQDERPIAGSTDCLEVQGSQDVLPRKKRDPWNPHSPEKVWVAEIVVQMGVPVIVEQWYEIQHNKLSAPEKSISRKTAKNKNIDTTGNNLKIHDFFHASKPMRSQTEVFRSSGKSNSMKGNTERSLQPVEENQNPLTSVGGLSDPRDLFKQPILGKPVRSNSIDVAKASAFMLGETIEDAIDIPSSPACVNECQSDLRSNPTTPHPPKPLTGQTEDCFASEMRKLSDSVTQRKQRRSKFSRSQSGPASTSISPSRNRSIKSFFGESSNEVLDGFNISQPAVSKQATSDVAKKPRRSKIFALGRDSLPGTWKEFEDDGVDSSRSKSKNPIAAMYVDLTSE